MKIAVSDSVVEETVGHISRADRSYYIFQDNLLRMSPSMVDAQVWHAVVRGFYYASEASDTIEWQSYWHGYYDPSDPVGYVRFLLGRSAHIALEKLDEIPEEWFPALELIVNDVHAHLEPQRLKAEFRDNEQMHSRAYNDVRMAMHLAYYETKAAAASAKGYVVSRDRGFLRAQLHAAWSPRPKVLIFTESLPALAGFLCGTILNPDPRISSRFFFSAHEI